jgi:hypothetical protein
VCLDDVCNTVYCSETVPKAFVPGFAIQREEMCKSPPYIYLLLLNVLFVTILHAEEDHELVGWLGETYRPENSSTPAGRQHGMVVLSWDPRIFLFKGFLTDKARQNRTTNLRAVTLKTA